MDNNFTDKDLMTDMLASQKFITDSYNTYTNECATPSLRNDFANILGEEHKMQSEVFNEMSARGWYKTEPAEQKKINAAKKMFAPSATVTKKASATSTAKSSASSSTAKKTTKKSK